MMIARHGSRVTIAALTIAVAFVQATAVRAQSGNPDPPTNPQVGNVTSTSAILSWAQGSPGVKFEVIVSPGNISFTNLNSTSLELSSLGASITYSWQVRSTKGNKLSGWVQGPGFTTSAAPPLPPSEAPAPPTDLQVSNVGSSSATLSWSGGGPGVKFELQVSPGNISDGNASSPYVVSSLSGNTAYGWQVRSTKGNKSSDWVQGPGLTTLAATAAQTVPAVPVLTSPEEASGNLSTSPTLSWSSSSGATLYELQFSTKQNFAPGQTQSVTTPATCAVISGLKDQTMYYWRVNASNGAGVSGWSGSWSFTTEAPRLSIAAAPAPTSPADGATGVRTSLTLSWNASKGATSYQVQVSFKENFPPGQAQEMTTSEASTTVSGLKNQTTYYWRVSASNEAGVSGWSGSWKFTTEALPLMAPAAPSLVSPADGEPGVSTSAMLSWDSSVGASSYWLQVSTKDNFAAGQTQEVTTSSAFATVSGLSHGTTYYWRVSASNGSARSGWSSVRSFVTIAAVMTDAEVSDALPREFKLSQNYPNPFNPSTTIQFSIPRTSHVMIRIYNALGHVVHNLVDESLPLGTHARQWAASQLPSGVYFCRIQAEGFVDTKRLVLMK